MERRQNHWGVKKKTKSIPNFFIFNEEFGSSAAPQTPHGSTPQYGHKSGQGVFIGGVQRCFASKAGGVFGASSSASAWVHARRRFRVQLPEESPNTKTHSGKHFGERELTPPPLWPLQQHRRKPQVLLTAARRNSWPHKWLKVSECNVPNEHDECLQLRSDWSRAAPTGTGAQLKQTTFRTQSRLQHRPAAPGKTQKAAGKNV